MALDLNNLNDHLYATNLAIADTINNRRSPEGVLNGLDNWISFLQGSSIEALNNMGADLQQLKDHLHNDDHAGTSAVLQRLGEQTSRAASNIHTWAGDHLHNGIGDQLRHLGQLLIVAAGNTRASL